MIKPKQNGDGDCEFFTAIKDPYNLLFNKDHDNSKTVLLTSLSELFDISETGRQVILVQGSPGSGNTTLANEICRQWAGGTLIQKLTLLLC